MAEAITNESKNKFDDCTTEGIIVLWLYIIYFIECHSSVCAENPGIFLTNVFLDYVIIFFSYYPHRNVEESSQDSGSDVSSTPSSSAREMRVSVVVEELQR